MGLASLVSGLTKNAIDLLGDLKGVGTFYSVSPGSYNPTSDVVTETVTTTANVPMVLCGFEKNEMEASPLTLVDAKILIAAEHMPGITPKEQDKILLAGRTWQIIRIKSPPSNPLWILLVKEG